MASSTNAGLPYFKPRAVSSHAHPPTSFTRGLFAGHTVRVKLEEIQKADLGRKYARKDKRPLDPPPVVLARFTSVIDPLSPKPCERPLDVDLAVIGAVCHVDLFPVPDLDEQSADPAHREPSTPSAVCPPPPPTSLLPSCSSLIHGSDLPAPYGGDGLRPFQEHLRPPRVQPAPAAYHHVALPALPFYSGAVPLVPDHAIVLPGVQSLAESGLPWPTEAREPMCRTSEDTDIIAWFGSFAIRESSKITSMLSGATFVQAEIVDFNGKREAMFVFCDLAVQTEGTFVLRYRTTNVFSSRTTSTPSHHISAECFGGSFKVYSTKEFPGLPPSTALTKLLSMYHIRVNVRENERKRRKRSEIEADLARANAIAAAPTAPRLMNIAPHADAGPSSSKATETHSPTASVGFPSTSGPASHHYPRSPTARGYGHPRRRPYNLQGRMDRDRISDEA